MKIDLHVHSKEISPCGHIACTELVKLYRDAGYDAIVLTNHFNSSAERILREKGVDDFGKAYLETYRKAAETGKKEGLLVLCGYELRFNENGSDYLVYGMPDEMALDCHRWFEMGAKDFSAVAAERGFLFYQAHPFRNGMTVLDPKYLFGIEVQNTHPGHDSRNDIALAWAVKYNLHRIAGSDCHQLHHVGTSAILTDDPVRTMDDLVDTLKNDRYTIV